MLPQIKVDPLVKVIDPSLLAFPEFPLVTAPVTVSEGLPLAAKVRNAVALAVFICNDAQVNVPFTVTV